MIRFLRPALLVSILALACFADTAPGADAGTTGMPCAPGSGGCPCYGNMTCDEPLVCDEDFCIDPQCVDGTENCPCLPSGGCDVGLVCEGVCKPSGGTSSAETSATSIEPSTTVSEVGPGDTGMTSITTDPGTSMTVDTNSEVGPVTMTDSSGCGACPSGSFCTDDACMDASPYVLCADCMSACVVAESGESICAPPCDPVGAGCPGVPGLPPSVCDDSDNDGSGNCVVDCTGEFCPFEMSCVALPDTVLVVCMWP